MFIIILVAGLYRPTWGYCYKRNVKYIDLSVSPLVLEILTLNPCNIVVKRLLFCSYFAISLIQ